MLTLRNGGIFMKKGLFLCVTLVVSIIVLSGCSCSNNTQKTGQITDTTVEPKNNQSSSSYNASNSSSSSKSNATNSTKNSNSIVGEWKVSTFAYPNDWKPNPNGGNVMYTGEGWSDLYNYDHPAPKLKFREDGKVHAGTAAGDSYIAKYVKNGDGSIVVRMLDTSNRGDIITFKYNQNDNKLTIENYTDVDGNVVTNKKVNGRDKVTDRTKAIGTVYKKAQ